MIVDVLRNDLGRVCRPGTRPRPAALPPRADRRGPAPRLDGDRPARRRARRLRPAGRVASRAGRSPVPRRSARWSCSRSWSRSGAVRTPGRSAGSGRTGRWQTSILIRTFVADGAAADPPRRRRHHLAQRPGRRVGRDRRQGARPARRDRRGRGRRDRCQRQRRRRHVWLDGRLRPADGAAPLGLRPRLPARRRRVRDAARPRRAGRPSCASTSPGSARSRRRPRDPAARRARRRSRRGIADLLAAEGLDGPDGDASVRITVSRAARSDAAGCCRPTDRPRPTIAIQAWPVVPPPADHLERGAAPRRVGRATRPVEPARGAQDHVAGGLRLRASSRRVAPAPTTRCSSRSTGDLSRGDDREHLPRPPGRGRRSELATPSLELRDPRRARPGPGCSAWGDRVGLARRRGPPDAGATSPRPTRRSCRRASPGSCRVDAVRRAADRRSGCPGRGRRAPEPTARR